MIGGVRHGGLAKYFDKKLGIMDFALEIRVISCSNHIRFSPKACNNPIDAGRELLLHLLTASALLSAV
jgi:hypothetical protein